MNTSEHQDSVYAYIGQRIRERRKLLKLSQTELAELMGFSYQQMQKYETGASHVSAGKLLLFARILNVPPDYFFNGVRLDPLATDRIDASLIQKTRIKAFRKLGAAGFIQKSVNLEEYMSSIAVLVKYWTKVVVLPRAA